MTDDQQDKMIKDPHSTWGHIYWWAILVVAVLAIPSIGFVLAALVPGNVGQILVFMLTCWACTFIGMRLMKK